MIYLLYSAIICMSHAKMIKIKKMCFTEQNSDSTNNTETFTHGFFLHEDVMTTVMNSTQTVIIIIFI